MRTILEGGKCLLRGIHKCLERDAMMGPGCGQGWEPEEKSRKIRLPSCEISCSFVGLMFVGAEWCERFLSGRRSWWTRFPQTDRPVRSSALNPCFVTQHRKLHPSKNLRRCVFSSGHYNKRHDATVAVMRAKHELTQPPLGPCHRADANGGSIEESSLS